MKSTIRLDGEGNPYLIVYYENKEGVEENALDDAERLFFTKLNQNGGLLHLVPGKDKQLRMIVTTGLLKRKANVTESGILGNPAPRAKETITQDGYTLAKVMNEAEVEEFPPLHGDEDVPGPTTE